MTKLGIFAIYCNRAKNTFVDGKEIPSEWMDLSDVSIYLFYYFSYLVQQLVLCKIRKFCLNLTYLNMQFQDLAKTTLIFCSVPYCFPVFLWTVFEVNIWPCGRSTLKCYGSHGWMHSCHPWLETTTMITTIGSSLTEAGAQQWNMLWLMITFVVVITNMPVKMVKDAIQYLLIF